MHHCLKIVTGFLHEDVCLIFVPGSIIYSVYQEILSLGGWYFPIHFPWSRECIVRFDTIHILLTAYFVFDIVSFIDLFKS